MEEKKKRKKKYYSESAKKWRERNPDYKKQWLLKNPGYNKDGYNNDPVKRRRYHKARCWAELGIDFKQVEDALISQGNKMRRVLHRANNGLR